MMRNRICGLLVSLHSRNWRDRYEVEFREVFAMSRLSAAELFSALSSALYSRMKDDRGAMLRYGVGMSIVLALLCTVGYVNLRSDEPQPPAMIIMLSCFGLTILKPRQAIIWTIAFAAAIPASYLVARSLHLPAVDPPQNLLETTIALIPAAIATSTALVARKLFHT